MKLDKVSLFYQDIGSGTPIVLLHGLTLSGSMWKPQIEGLSDSFRLIVPDLRGHGNSSAPEHGYTIRDYVSDIKDLIDQLELPKVHLIGLSLGGAIATEFSVDYSHLLRSTIVISPVPQRLISGNDLEGKISIFRKVMAKDGVEIAVENVLLKDSIFGKINVGLNEWINLKKGIIQFSGYPLNENFSTENDSYRVMELLQAFDKPFMIITGENDIDYFHSAAGALDTALPNSQIVSIEDAGHLCTIEQPEKINRILLKFINSVETKRKLNRE
ncbi:alpha/beta hydrolase [candidate division KSB1 bacterium]|nr:alpha/beta hydrolase [candidate division KSB1 bacterium]